MFAATPRNYSQKDRLEAAEMRADLGPDLGGSPGVAGMAGEATPTCNTRVPIRIASLRASRVACAAVIVALMCTSSTRRHASRIQSIIFEQTGSFTILSR